MEIINATKGVLLADKVIVADTLGKRLLGLIGKRGLGEREALIIVPCSAIHTFFMRFPIDAIFLNKGLKVLKVIKEMPPFRISLPLVRARIVVEFPSGAVGISGTEVGDSVEIKD